METDMRCYGPDGQSKELPNGDAVFDAWLDPGATAIVCIDMHRSHIGDDEGMPLHSERATAAVREHDVFNAAARELGVPVIMVQHWQRHGGIDDRHSKTLQGGANWRHTARLFFDGVDEGMDELGWEGTKWVDLMIEDDPERDYYVRTKKRLSAFYPTDLEHLLRQLAVRNVVVTGTLTDCCCLNTAFDAANRDFRVLMPRDVAAGLSEEMEQAAFKVVASHLGLVVDGPPLVREWAARLGREAPGGLADVATMRDLDPAGATSGA